jgi:acetate kinase
MAILALNAGSSNLKAGLFEWQPGVAEPLLLARQKIRDRPLDWAQAHLGDRRLIAVGHRVVHGGADASASVEIDEPMLARLEALTPLAPLHQPASLEPVRRIREACPGLRQFACFDTAFHRSIGLPASRYALPRALEEEGIRRYGFHGLSYESIATQLAADEKSPSAPSMSRIIVAHLGNGASLCALSGLKSVDTTMGFSTLDGLVMGTRPGALDPGIMLYLLQEKHFSVGQLEELLYKQSGLLGVSGISADVADLVASDSPAAAAALDLFAFQVARQTAALAATLGGIDQFIFTGGIGEHSPVVRRLIADRLQWLGAALDEQANDSNARTISSEASGILLERRSTQEELMIARHVVRCIGDRPID